MGRVIDAECGERGGDEDGNARPCVSTDLGRQVSMVIYRAPALGGVTLGLSPFVIPAPETPVSSPKPRGLSEHLRIGGCEGYLRCVGRLALYLAEAGTQQLLRVGGN